MKLNLKIVLIILSLSFSAKSQNTDTTIKLRKCGTLVPPKEWDIWFNEKVQSYKETHAQSKNQTTSITIPVIVHVIHPGSQVNIYPNLSSAQIWSQIDVLNKDFAGIGLNSHLLANTGFSLVGIANTNITFCLAQYDPMGNLLPEPGINRIDYNTMGWTNPATPNTLPAFRILMENTIKPNSIWDPTAYLNIWISDVHPSVDILGYASFPNGSNLAGISSNLGTSSNDGVWVWARSFGKVGTLSPPYNLGRTTTHEVGHWLGLRHIGGDGNGNPAGDCDATDFCDDTPPQKGGASFGAYGQNFGSPAYPLHANVCFSNPYGDMFMNFMDYTDDAALYMFTPDQNIRMQTALVEGYFRSTLGASAFSLCVDMPLASFINDSVGCINSGITPLNATFGTPVPTYSWSAQPSVGVTFSPGTDDASPHINFPVTGSYTITMVATNTIGVTSNTMVVRIEDCTGVGDNFLLAEHVRLLPNPTAGEVTISGLFNSATSFVEIHNALGQLIVSGTYTAADGNRVMLDLTNYPEGVYTVTLVSEGQKVVKKLVLSSK